MEVFGIIGMGIGTVGMVLGAADYTGFAKREKHLKESGVWSKDYKSTVSRY